MRKELASQIGLLLEQVSEKELHQNKQLRRKTEKLIQIMNLLRGEGENE